MRLYFGEHRVYVGSMGWVARNWGCHPGTDPMLNKRMSDDGSYCHNMRHQQEFHNGASLDSDHILDANIKYGFEMNWFYARNAGATPAELNLWRLHDPELERW